MTDTAFFHRSFDSDTVPAIEGAFPKVTAVVVALSDPERAAGTLAGLRRARYPRLDTVLVAEQSPAADPPPISARFPEVTLLGVSAGWGEAAASNLGVQHALAVGSDYVLLLCRDAELDPAMVAELVDAAEATPTVGCAGPKTYCDWDRERLWGAGARIEFRRRSAAERGAGEIDRGQFDRMADVDCLAACGLLLKRSAVEQVGLFDPAYRVGRSDADWCLRARRLGFRCRYVPRARLWRRSVPPADSGEEGYHAGRDWALLARRHARGLDWARFWLGLAGSLPADYVGGLLRGDGGAAAATWRGVVAGMQAPLAPPPGVRTRDA